MLKSWLGNLIICFLLNASVPANKLTRSILETSSGPLTKITEGSSHLTTNKELDAPKPKPRVVKTPDQDTQTDITHEQDDETLTEIDSYIDRKNFWESISTSKTEASAKKRMSLYEEQKIPLIESLAAKRASVHDIPSVPPVPLVPPVPRPRTVPAASTSVDEDKPEQTYHTEPISVPKESPDQAIMSEYMASFKDPSQKSSPPSETKKPQKSESLDSEAEYISKYGVLEAYENVGYESDGHPEDNFDTDAEIIDHGVPQIKTRQMSVSHPPVAAARKTIFERSVSLPGEDLQDISEQSVKARKRFFEQQIKNEMVIDQLMTQLEEEQVPEVKTLKEDVVQEAQKTVSSAPELLTKELSTTKIEPKFSPCSSSSQDTKTEEDITQDTPGSVKDLTKVFQAAIVKESIRETLHTHHDISHESAVETSHPAESEQFESSLTESSEDIKKEAYNEESSRDDVEPKSEMKSTTESVEQEPCMKQFSTESDHSISSERSLELGSMGDVPHLHEVHDGFHYKSDSMSKPSDSLEVHVDKSETEDSEKITDIDQDFTSKSHSFEMRSYGSLEHHEEHLEKPLSSPIHQPKEHIPDTVWEVIQTQPSHDIEESVTEFPYRHEREEEFSRSAREEAEASDFPHKEHAEVEKLILESLYHQKIHPDEARKIAAELIDDIETEIERRNMGLSAPDEDEPPAPHPDVAKNQISEYLRQLAECKGLDEREVQLVESVLARKHSQISRLSRRDTQTSSMEITDEDLKYSGAECDLSPYDSQENILEEHVEESEKTDTFEKTDKMFSDKEQHVEKRSEDISKDIHLAKDEEKYEGDAQLKYKSELEDRLQIHEEEVVTKTLEQSVDKDQIKSERTEEKSDKIKKTEDIEAFETMQIKTDDALFNKATSTKIRDDEQEEAVSKLATTEILTDTSKLRKSELDEKHKTHVALGGTLDTEIKSTQLIEGGVRDTKSTEKVEVSKDLKEEVAQKRQQTEEIKITDDGTQILTSEIIEETRTKTQRVSEVVDHKIEETVTTFERVIEYDPEHPKFLRTIENIIEYEIDPSEKVVTIETLTEYDVEEPLSEKTAERVEYECEEQLSERFATSDKGSEYDVEEPLSEKEIHEEETMDIKSADIIKPILPHDRLKQTYSDESKSSQEESMKSPEDKSSSSSRKDDNAKFMDKPDVIFRKSKLRKEFDSGSSSSGNLRADRKSGADFEYSSSGESHYHSFEDSARSRPCSSDVEGLLAAGSSEYESALTTQADVSSRSQITSAEYHTAVSSLSSRESMKSLDTESSGNMASVEVSEASETLVASTFEMDGDILEGAQLLEDEVVEGEFNHIQNDYLDKGKSSFDTVSDSEPQGESIDISEEDQDKIMGDDLACKMKRSQEMTFQPEPKVVIGDSPQSETAVEMDERFASSLEDGSVLSMSLSSASDMAALRTVIELSRRDSDKVTSGTSGQVSLEDSDHSNLPHSREGSLTASNVSLDQKTSVDISTSTAHAQDTSVGSVTITTSTVHEDGTQSVSTQVTSQTKTEETSEVKSETVTPPEREDVVETKKVRGHRRNESTSFTPSMISGFAAGRTDIVKHDYLAESDKYEMSLKEQVYDEMKDIDETEKEEDYETEADQDYHKQQREAQLIEEEFDIEIPEVNEIDSRPQSGMTEERPMSVVFSEDRPDSELIELMQQGSVDTLNEPIERPLSPEPCEEYEIKEEEDEEDETLELYRHLQMRTDVLHRLDDSDILSESKISDDFKESEVRRHSSGVLSEKSSFEEAEAESAFGMVAHISPAHKAKPICPILEDDDAEKHELETRERAQKDMEERRAQILKDASPGSIPDITVTQHMTPLTDRGFHYPDLELEENEEEQEKSTPQTPASNSSKSSEETDQGREYVLDETSTTAIIEEPEAEIEAEKLLTESVTSMKSEVTESVTIASTIQEKTIQETKQDESKPAEPPSATESPNSDSFELLEQPDIIDDFVVIEEVAREAAETDTEGKGLSIKETKYIRKHDEEVEEYLVHSAPTPLTRMTDIKYYPDGSSGDELGPFDFEDSPPQAGKKNAEKTQKGGFEYDREVEANKKWMEMQFQGDQAQMMAAGYGYEMEFERGPLEDIKEEEATDFDPSSSRIGSLESQKHSGGSLGSVKDSFSSTPEYDVLAGRKFFTRSGEHDDVSMSSLQEFEHLERVISLENRRYHQGSQDSSSNGSFNRRYHSNRQGQGQGDDVSLSSLKEFEGLESACIAAHHIEVKAKEEEALLAQIEEGQEKEISEISESFKLSTDSKATQDKEEDDYDKRIFEIDEIIRQAQSNVEKFIDLGDKEESIGRGDSLEEVAKVPDLELDEPIVKTTKVTWSKDDPLEASMDSLAEQKATRHSSADSLDLKKTEADIMTASTDSIEFQAKSAKTENIMTDSIEIHDDSKSCMINSDSLELTQGTHGLTALSDSIDEDGSRIGDHFGQDQSSSSGKGDDYSSSGREDNAEQAQIQNQCAEFLIGSTDSLDPTSSTATHATYQYETDSVMSGSFTSGGSNTMVSSTDTIDPLAGKEACGVDLAAAVRKVWFDDDAFDAGHKFTTELLDDGSKPFVTEVIEPCEDDPEYSHTIHRRVEMPPEIKKITFHGPDADQQLRQYVENFGEGEDVQESQEVDKDGNIHVKRVVQKRFIVKSEGDGTERHLSGPELESYLQHVSQMKGDFDLKYKDGGHDTYEDPYRQHSSDVRSDTLTHHLDYQQGRM